MRTFPLLVLLTLGVAASSCDSADSAADARLTVRLTDAPFPFDLAEAAEVTLTRIELLAAEPDDDASNDTSATEGVRGRVVLFEGAARVNLLDLRDGVDTLLVDRAVIPADGAYNRLRFFVADDAEVRFTDGQVFALKLPSAQQSGIKVTLPEGAFLTGDDVDVLIDFNVERSFVTRGNPGSAGFQGFLFKPVLEVESFEVAERPAAEAPTGG